MNSARRTSFVFLSLLGGAALVSSHADAQSFRKAPLGDRPTTVERTPPPPATRTTNIANLSTDVTGGGTVNVGTNGSLGGTPILNGFHFRFTNGDHKFQRIGLRPTGAQTAYVTYRDRKADDRYKAAATWITLNGGGVRGEVAAKIWQQSFVKLPTQRPANSRLVLTGFELRFPDRNDYKVRMIGIWLDEATNMARVSFIDGGYSPALGAAGPAFSPKREAKIQPSVDLDRFSGSLSDDATVEGWIWEPGAWTKSAPEAAVRIQYAWIPNDTVAGDLLLTGSQRAPDSGVQFPARSGIQGFEFRYDSGGDHNLLEIGVMPPLPGAATRTATGVRANEFVAFQDQNRDDAIKWAVKVVNLK
ncbi:MAG: hypothetical protein KF894_13540 [Labilithrix sp.]|nr:hypothetical protein [Labilithrix sp.]